MTQHDLLPFPDVPPLDHDAMFLAEENRQWTGTELLTLAARMSELVPRREDRTIAISSASAAFVAAGALAAWKLGMTPLILDPNLKNEPAAILEQHPGLPVLVGEHGTKLGNPIVVDGSTEAPLEAVWPEDRQILAQFFTSGSTGEPKVVTKRAFQIFNQMQHELPWMGIAGGTRLMAMVPPFHILGFVYGLVMPMLARGSTTFLHGAAPAAWADRLHRIEPHVVVGVPSHYRFLLSCLDQEPPPALFLSSGGPLTPDIEQEFRERCGQTIVQVYGSTETGGVATRRGFGGWTPFPGLKWRVRGEDGRLMVSSPWQERPDHWTVTDDLAEATATGFELKGRADSIVKVGGKRYSTNEILQVVEDMPGVAAALSVTYERFGENAVALFVAPASGRDLTEHELRSELNAQLAPFKVPRTIRILDELPLLSNGKVDRRQLSRLAADDENPDEP